jgi:hypothetical protein
MFLRALSFLALAVPSAAQNFDFVIDQTQSGSSVYADLETDLLGSVIGDYDAATNPGGTRTVNGIFGGSGNEVVALSTTIDNLATFSGAPSGVFSMNLDPGTLSMSLSGTDVDILAGSSGTASVSVTLLFSTFRTYNPDSLYVGGIPVTIPLGNINVTGATAVQTGASMGGTLVPGAGANDYDFAAVVPVLMTLTADFNGVAIPIPPIDLSMPVTGLVTLTSSGATASAGFAFNNQTATNDPFPGFQLTNVPVSLPTILPPGFLANLLLTATVAAIDTDIQIDLNLVADGTPGSGGNCNVVFCDTDLNNLGDVTLSTCDCSGGSISLDLSTPFTNQFTYPLVGLGTTAVSPTGVSELCLAGSTIGRYSNDAGAISTSGTYSIDLLNAASAPGGGVPTIGGALCNGNTWRFQYWHRDGMNPSRFSKGISGLIN